MDVFLSYRLVFADLLLADRLPGAIVSMILLYENRNRIVDEKIIVSELKRLLLFLSEENMDNLDITAKLATQLHVMPDMVTVLLKILRKMNR